MLKTAAGTTLGAAFPYFPSPSNVAPYVGVGFASPPAFGLVDTGTGRLTVEAQVYFAQAGCTGDAAMAVGVNAPLPLYAYQAYRADRIFAATTTTSVPFLFLSRYDANGAGCNETGGAVNVKPDAWRAAEILVAPYPFASPLSLSYE